MLKFVMLPPHNDIRRTWRKRLQDGLSQYQIVVAETEADARREIVDADAAYGWIPPDLLSLAGKLRWIQSHEISPKAGFYYQALIDHPVVVTNPRGTFNDCLSHHTMMFILALSRSLPYFTEAQRQKRWDRNAPKDRFVDLASSTGLIYGVGGIGQETARLCMAFGMRVIGIDNRWEYETPGVEKHAPGDLDDLLPEADFVIVTVPHTPETEGMWQTKKFRLMKNTAYFINIGRGLTTRLDDLVDALEAGVIAGCALDVYETEPLPVNHKLWSLQNAILTPHTAAKDADTVSERQFEILGDNLQRFADGKPLVNVVDKTVWH
jgi:phosphoglycerate dehydrogenase-like enzyme